MNSAISDDILGGRWEDILTPEGVEIRLKIAAFGRRAMALTIDFFIIMVSIFILFIVFGALALVGEGFGAAAGIVAWFFMLNFYFPLFEGMNGGRTPGKVLTKIRVVDRSGGALTLRAVFARNFMRDLELWLPLKIGLFNESVFGGLPEWAVPVALLWAALLALFPLFNGRRLRLGDLVAGTMVVENPKIQLLRDMAAPSVKAKTARAEVIKFTPEQLAIYGIYELHVLEELLRQCGQGSSQTLNSVATKIKKKIDWQGPKQVTSKDFLDSFYSAQRARLEEQMVLGKKKLSKFE